MKMLRHFGLIGYPLSHSQSAKYFTEKFEREGILDTEFNLYPLEKIEDILDLREKIAGLRGLNVTIPYKTAVMKFLDEIDEGAESVGAVNTILFQNGFSKGYNTDVFGFEQSLLNVFSPVEDKGALILGTGGASKAAAYVMKKWNLDYQFVSRNPSAGNEIHYSDLTEDLLNNKQLIIQTTPLGMKPNIETCPPIPFEYLNEQHFLFDMVYNPEKTIFLSLGMERGCKGMNGQIMFQLQAEEAWRIWNQKT